MFFETKLALVVLFLVVYFNVNCQAKPQSCFDGHPLARENNNIDDDQNSKGNQNNDKGGGGGKGGNSDNNHNNRNNPQISTEPSKTKKKKKCCPYDFDSTKCRIVDDRIICGFNNNKGKVRDPSQSIDLHNGCMLRGKKLECGYKNGPPYDGIRRPPAWDDPSGGGDSRENRNHNGPNNRPSNQSPCGGGGCPQKRQPWDNSNHEMQAEGVGVTKCLEIGQRIVCSPLRQLNMNYG